MKSKLNNSYVTGIMAAFDRLPDGNIETRYVTGFNFDGDGFLSVSYGSRENAYKFNVEREQDKNAICSIKAQIDDFEVSPNDPTYISVRLEIIDSRSDAA